jgi:hypothetical protein
MPATSKYHSYGSSAGARDFYLARIASSRASTTIQAVTNARNFQNECRTPWTRDPSASTTMTRRNAINAVTSSYSLVADDDVRAALERTEAANKAAPASNVIALRQA